MTDPTTSRVTAQYQAYSYPPPIMDLAAAIKNGAFLTGDPAKFSAMIWPEGRSPQNLKILVAGCGTYEAAFLAFAIRRARCSASTSRARASNTSSS